MRNLKRFLTKYKQKAADYGSNVVKNIFKRQQQLVMTKPPKMNSIKPGQTIKLSKMQYPELDKFFIRFFNSKSVEGRVPNKSLAFVIGAENIGKSQYINKNIIQIKKRKAKMLSQFNRLQLPHNLPQFDIRKTPEYLEQQIQQTIFDNQHYIILKTDYKQNKGLNFIGFIEDMHEKIFDEIEKLLNDFEAKNKRNKKIKAIQSQQSLDLLSPQILKSIITHTNSSEYLFVYVKDVIYSILEGKDQIQVQKQTMQKLDEFNDKISGESSQRFWDQFYLELVQILANKTKGEISQNHKTFVAMKLFYSVFCRIQYENRPSQFLHSWYQSGIQTTNYLFDILNFLSGTGKFIQSIEKQFISLDTSSQRKEEIKTFLNNSNNFILKGNHVDIMMCLMNLEDLDCFQNRNKQFIDFFDHIICRTVHNSSFRTHFPIVIELPNRQFLDQTLQIGKVEGSNPVIVQLPGYIQSLLRFSNVVQIFEVNKVQALFPKLGRNPHNWNSAINYMAKGGDIEDIYLGKADFQQKQKIIAQAKINKIFTDQKTLPYLNSGNLPFELIYLIQILTKIKGMGSSAHTFYSTLIFKKPLFQNLLANNIVYHQYYLPYFQYQNNPTYLNFYDEFSKKIKKKELLVILQYLETKVKKIRNFLWRIGIYFSLIKTISIASSIWQKSFGSIILVNTLWILF